MAKCLWCDYYSNGCPNCSTDHTRIITPYKRNDFWIPKNKSQLVEWFVKFYKGKYAKNEISKKSKKELLGWYFSVR